MHRLGRQKRLIISYVRTAIIAVLFLLVAIPFVNKVANGGKTYTPDERYMVVLNGTELGYVSDASTAQTALKNARNQINSTNSGLALMESDISVYKETAGGSVITEEELTSSMYTLLSSTNVATKNETVAYTVRVEDFTVTLGSKEEVVELFELVKERYSNSNEFTVELVENTDGSYTTLETNIVSADVTINEAAQVLASLSTDSDVVIDEEEIVFADGVLSIGFKEEVEVIETKASKANVVSVEEAYELITKEHAEKGTYQVQSGDCISGIAKLHGLTIDEFLALNGGMDINSTIYPGEELIVTVPASEINVVVKEEMTYEEDYNAPIQYVDNNSLYRGTENVIKQGTAGHREVVAIVTYVNGVETSREIINETIFVEATPTVIERGTLTPPTYIKPVNSNMITSAFGWRDHPITGQWSFHSGVDWNASMGTPVKASASGVVVRAGWYGAYGNCVDIRHVDGSLTRYAHLSGFAVTYGQTVNQGQVIAYVGSTGVSTGAHLHFEIHLRYEGNYVDPVTYTGR